MKSFNNKILVLTLLSFACLTQSSVHASDSWSKTEHEAFKRVLLTGIPTGRWTEAKASLTQQIKEEAIDKRADQLMKPFGRIYGRQARLLQLHGSCGWYQAVTSIEREEEIQKVLRDHIGVAPTKLIVSCESLTEDPCPIM